MNRGGRWQSRCEGEAAGGTAAGAGGQGQGRDTRHTARLRCQPCRASPRSFPPLPLPPSPPLPPNPTIPLPPTHPPSHTQVRRPGVLESVSLDLYLMRQVGVALRKVPDVKSDWAGIIDAWAMRFLDEVRRGEDGAQAVRVLGVLCWVCCGGRASRDGEAGGCREAANTLLHAACRLWPVPPDAPLTHLPHSPTLPPTPRDADELRAGGRQHAAVPEG